MSNYTVWVSYLLCRYAGTFLACRNYKNWVSNITTMQKMIPIDFLSYKGLDDVWVFIWFILLSFTVDDMYGERLYLVNMNLSFCFESSAACYKTIVVFSDTLLPKTSCSWNSQQGLIFYIYLSSIKIFKQIQNMVKCKLDLKQFFFYYLCWWHGFAGFSLSDWRSSNGVPAGGSMSGWPELLLYEELDIAQYVYSTQCVRGAGLYTSSSVSGVNIGFNTDAASYSQCKLDLI